MKVNFFIPKYMQDFKCIGPKCTDTCCSGWDINIDKSTFFQYETNTGKLKELVKNKYIINTSCNDSFNYGFMILSKDNSCPFLNEKSLCNIHGNCGEEYLSITCKRYPRVFNIIDDIYEKSGLPSCEEICSKAFLNKDKMEFIETVEELDESSIEIRRVIDTEAFIDSDSLIQYFWDIRIISINIMQDRKLKIEERLIKLKSFYKKLEFFKNKNAFDEIEEFIEILNENTLNINNFLNSNSTYNLDISIKYFKFILNKDLLEKIKGHKIKKLLLDLSNDKFLFSKLSTIDLNLLNNQLDQCSHIFENYLVNQIFKDIIPFNTSGNLVESINQLIGIFKLIKSYLILWNTSSKISISEKNVLYLIQTLSKDIEHNKAFKEILTVNL